MQVYYGEYRSPDSELYIKEYVHEINRFRFNWHEFLELIIVVHGKMEAYVGGQVYCLSEDDVLLINSNVGHATLLRQVGTKAIVIHLSPKILCHFDGYQTFHFHCVSKPETRNTVPFRRLRRYAAGLLKEFTCQDSASPFCIEALTKLLVVSLLRDFPPERVFLSANPKGHIPQKTLDVIIAYTEKHYKKRITLEDISALTQYNPAYISAFFKSNIGINYYEYLQRVRLRHAIHALNKTTRSITEIALDAGFADPKSFATTFKRYFVMTPTQYRESIKHDATPVIDELVRIYVPAKNEIVEQKLDEYLSEGFQKVPNLPAENMKTEETLKQIRNLCEDFIHLIGDI